VGEVECLFGVFSTQVSKQQLNRFKCNAGVTVDGFKQLHYELDDFLMWMSVVLGKSREKQLGNYFK
jgi:hypothetical protein